MQGNNQQVMLSAEQFMGLTQAKSSKVVSVLNYTDGGSTAPGSIRLPSAGLGHMVWVQFAGTFTVAGTVTGGTFKNYPIPAPFGWIKRVRFGSNANVLMRDLTGFGWYKWVRQRYGIDPLNSHNANLFAANNLTLIGAKSSTRMTPGANVAAQTYNFNLVIPMPLSYNEMGEVGLLNLQQQNTFFDMNFDFGTITGGLSATGGSNDIITGLTGSGLSYSATMQITVGLDWFDWIPGTDQLLSSFMAVNETVAPNGPLVAGDNIVPLQPNDFYTLIMAEVSNNGDVVTPANMSNIKFTYAGQVLKHNEDYGINVGRTYWRNLTAPLDANIIFDYGIRRGVAQRRDMFDAFSANNVTSPQLGFTLPGSLSITTPSQVSLITEAVKLMEVIRTQ